MGIYKDVEGLSMQKLCLKSEREFIERHEQWLEVFELGKDSSQLDDKSKANQEKWLNHHEEFAHSYKAKI